MRRVPTHLPGMLTRDEFVAAYAERTGRTVTPEQWRFYEVFGLFRMAAIAQQIYYRYFHGQTTNEMYALFGPAVQIIGRRLDGLIDAPVSSHPPGPARPGVVRRRRLRRPLPHRPRAVARAGCRAGRARRHPGRRRGRRDAPPRRDGGAACSTGAGWTADPVVDAGWNEFDHDQVLGVHDSPDGRGRASRRRPPSSAGSRRRPVAGRRAGTTRRTTSRSPPSPAASTPRWRASSTPCRPQGTAVVLTSGGAIAWTVASLLADDTAGSHRPLAAAQPGLDQHRHLDDRPRRARHDPRRLQRARPPLPRPAHLPLGPLDAHRSSSPARAAASAPRWPASSPPSATTWRCAHGVRTGSTSSPPRSRAPTPAVRVAVKALDVNDHDAVFRVFDEFAEELGGLDKVVVNAGLGKGQPLGTGRFDANLADGARPTSSAPSPRPRRRPRSSARRTPASS